MKINSFKTKILLWFGGVVGTVLIFFSFGFYYFFQKSVELNLQNSLYEQAENIEAEILAGKHFENIIKQYKYKNINIILCKNNLISKNKNFYIDNYKYCKQNIKKDKFFLKKTENYLMGIYILPFEKSKTNKFIVVTDKINNTIEDLEDILLISEPLLLLILLFLAGTLIDKILYPIENITKIAKEISIKNFSNFIKAPKDFLEIKALVDTFNEMILRLQEGVKTLERFNSDVSHELKTPLTVINGEIDVVLKKKRDVKDYIKSLKIINYEIKQIEQIVDSLLFLSIYSKENISNTFETCYIDAILLNILAKYETTIKEKNIKLCIEKIEPIILHSNKQLLTTIFSNLIDNAIKYTPNKRNIFIKLYKSKNINFIIKDEGIGISKKEIVKVTKKFYRVDTSRTKIIKGFGLGLSLVKNSVELLNANMKIDSKLGKGTTVCIVFL